MKPGAALALGLLLLGGALAPAAAQPVRRDGYVRRDTGTYVPPSYATRPDRSRLNNYSSRPNINPYSGQRGTRDPLRPPSRSRRR